VDGSSGDCGSQRVVSGLLPSTHMTTRHPWTWFLTATLLGCQARIGDSPGSAGYDAYACPDGYLCDGTPVTGSPGQTVCCHDLHEWTCPPDGWHPLGTTCACGSGGGVLFASPTGSGTACTQAAPCSLIGARDQVRTMNASMTADIVVWLLGGTYAQTDT